MPDLLVGARAPDFTLPDDAGRTVRLSDLRGQWVVLTFYAEDDTPVCRAQVCSLRDAFTELRAAGAVVLAVSGDPVSSHATWRKKERLPFALLSDADHKVASRYGAHGEKTMYGRKVEGVIRTTVILDPRGRIAALFRRLRSAGHGARVAAALRELQAAGVDDDL
jgi:peroxiredoxin Q/BCP